MRVKTGFKYLSFEISDFTPENVQLRSIWIFADIGGYICENKILTTFYPNFHWFRIFCQISAKI